MARRALEEDLVVEAARLRRAAAAEVRRAAATPCTWCCIPMAAAGRWVGVIVGDRPADAPRLDDGERHLLWTLGKTAALAAVARIATSQASARAQLEERIDLARDIHDGAIQRLFGVSLALAGDGSSTRRARQRCAAELEAALARAARRRPAPARRAPRGRPARRSRAELERLAREHPASASPRPRATRPACPRELEALAQSVLVEAIRNAQKHAARRGRGRARARDGAFVIEVVNDGVREGTRRRRGMGLRLAALEALQHGGVVEFGPQRARRLAGAAGGARCAAERARRAAPRAARPDRRRPRRRALGLPADARPAAWVERAWRADGDGGPRARRALRAARRARRPVRRRRVRARDLRAAARAAAAAADPADLRRRADLAERRARRRRAGFVQKDWPAATSRAPSAWSGAGRPCSRRRRSRRRDAHRARARGARADRLRRDQPRDRGALFLSPHTVKEHTSSLYRKLEVRNRAEAVQRAQRLGLLA